MRNHKELRAIRFDGSRNCKGTRGGGPVRGTGVMTGSRGKRRHT